MDAQSDTFIHRILRLLAWVGLTYGCFLVLGVIAEGILGGVKVLTGRFPGPGTFGYLMLGRAAVWTSHVTVVMLLVGSIGLLLWKPWSRRVLISWALLRIVAVVLLQTNNVLVFTSLQAATTQPVYPSLLYYLLIILTSVALAIALPAIVLGVLIQPEVKDLWAQEKRGGFEVIPLAKVASDAPEPRDGSPDSL